MFKISLNTSCFFALLIILVMGLCALLFVKNNSMFSCDSNVYYYENEELKSNIQFSLYLFHDKRGSFDLYGYVNDSSNKITTKIARRLSFKYESQGGVFFIEHNHTDRFNNDNTVDSKLPEFISSKKQIIHIERLNSNDYLIYDKASPTFICRKRS